jgi:hypothetical protein
MEQKPHILPYDDEYVLISKRRLVAGNLCIADSATRLSAVTNTSRTYMIKALAANAIRNVKRWSQQDVDKHVQGLISSSIENPPDDNSGTIPIP